MQRLLNRAAPFNRPRGVAPAENEDKPVPETRSVKLKAKLYTSPGHAAFPAGATVELGKSLADELERLEMAETPPKEEAAHKA